MKNQVLSIEQMQKLKELGVDISKASMVCLFQDDESNICDWDEVVEECSEFGDCFQYFVKNDECSHNMVYMSLLDAEGGYYDHSYREDCAAFTLQDIIELLPYEFNGSYLKIYRGINMYYFIYENINNEDSVMEKGDTVLNAAYNMLIWVAENGYLKTK